MRTLFFFGVYACSLLHTLAAQETPRGVPNRNFLVDIDPPTGIRSSRLTGRYSLGPDPQNASQMFPLLTQQSIQDELQLNDVQIKAIQSIEQDHQARLYEVAPKTTSEAVQREKRAMEMKLIEKVREERAQALEEILLPEQLVRLRQICYRYDVATRGIVTALTDGRLREAAGVHDNQVAHLQQKGQEIEEKARRDILAIMKRVEEEMFAELSADQRKLAKAALGEYFVPEDVDRLKVTLKNSQRHKPIQANSPAPEKTR